MILKLPSQACKKKLYRDLWCQIIQNIKSEGFFDQNDKHSSFQNDGKYVLALMEKSNLSAAP